MDNQKTDIRNLYVDEEGSGGMDHLEQMRKWLHQLFGETMRDYRKKRGMSQLTLGNAVNDAFRISKTENGEGNLTFDSIVTLAYALRITVGELFSRVDAVLQGTPIPTDIPKRGFKSRVDLNYFQFGCDCAPKEIQDAFYVILSYLFKSYCPLEYTEVQQDLEEKTECSGEIRE